MSSLPPIIIVDYRPAWPQEYGTIAAQLRRAVSDLALRVDHIGSTAVPGLAAKDVIDLQITVRDFDPRLEAALLTAGYTRRTDIDHDHIPPNVTRTSSEWIKQYYQAPADQRRTNVHVRIAGHANQRYPILFRDYLRAHPLAVGAYAAIKRALSNHAPDDWDLYYDIKDPVCDVIMAAADDWAKSTGWEQGESE